MRLSLAVTLDSLASNACRYPDTLLLVNTMSEPGKPQTANCGGPPARRVGQSNVLFVTRTIPSARMWLQPKAFMVCSRFY